MKRILVAPALAAAVLAAPAAARTTHHIVIRHQIMGCHAWSLDGGPFRASLALRMRRGDAIEITNDDAMSHRLVEVAGRRIALPPAMGEGTFHHPGAGTVRVVFMQPGIYRFRTVDGEDATKPLPTAGPSAVLRLVVRVV